MGILSAKFEIGFAPGDKECLAQMQHIQSGKIQISAVHYVERSWLYNKRIQDIYFVHLAIAYMNERRDVAAKIQ